MILDNVDDEKAVAGVAGLTARLKGGHVIATARGGELPPSVAKLELDVLDEGAAVSFFIERTRDDRCVHALTTRSKRTKSPADRGARARA